MSTWEERMSIKAKERARKAALAEDPWHEIPSVLRGELPEGEPDIARHWCTSCGLPDAPVAEDKYAATPPCPRCGSLWRWYGRLADRDGTATAPPESDLCRECYEWRRYPGGQKHFGWSWWCTCGPGLGIGPQCPHEHHKHELWLASC